MFDKNVLLVAAFPKKHMFRFMRDLEAAELEQKAEKNSGEGE